MRCFFFNDTATTEIYTLSLHDALPILGARGRLRVLDPAPVLPGPRLPGALRGVRARRARRRRALRARVLARRRDRKSTRLNSSHANISYAVFCLNKKITTTENSDSTHR